MFAIVKTGGKQYLVSEGSVIKVEKLDAEPGKSITFDSIMSGTGASIKAALASVTAEVIAHQKADKVLIFKKHRRHNYRRKNGHRQNQTVLRITGIKA